MNCRKSKKSKTIECLIKIVAYTQKGANSSVLVGKDVPILLLAPVVLPLLQTQKLFIQHHFLITDFNMVSTVIIILTFVAVYGHKCKDFMLSASDQSVIDMMKHYLHTSRKTECSDNTLSNIVKQINILGTNIILKSVKFSILEKTTLL